MLSSWMVKFSLGSAVSLTLVNFLEPATTSRKTSGLLLFVILLESDRLNVCHSSGSMEELWIHCLPSVTYQKQCQSEGTAATASALTMWRENAKCNAAHAMCSFVLKEEAVSPSVIKACCEVSLTLFQIVSSCLLLQCSIAIHFGTLFTHDCTIVLENRAMTQLWAIIWSTFLTPKFISLVLLERVLINRSEIYGLLSDILDQKKKLRPKTLVNSHRRKNWSGLQAFFFLLKSRLQSHFVVVNCGVFWWWD